MAWKIVSAAMMAAGLLGCSVHSQAPIRQVAYDFSDHAYYDRDFAPSPNYAEGQGYYGHAWAAPVAQQQHVHVSHVEGSCGCDHEGHAAPSARGNDDESATNDREEPRRAARPRVDFGGDRDGSVASGRVNERDADTSDDSSRRRPRFTTSRPAASSASEGEGRAEPAARPVSTRPEVSRPAEAQSRRAAPAAGRPMAAPEARRSMKTSGDDRIAGR